MLLLIIPAPVLFWFLGNSKRVEQRKDKDALSRNLMFLHGHQSSGYWRSKILTVMASEGPDTYS